MAAVDEEYQDSDDEIFRELEKDDDDLTDRMRESRLASLKKELEAKREARFGTYDIVSNEKKLMLMTTSTPKMVIHFAHKDFKKCKVMDGHLQTITRKHASTRFVKVDVEDVPFLVDRMEIKVLPCVISFIDGVGVDRLLGFEGISLSDEFPTYALEKRLAQTGVIELLKDTSKIFKFEKKQDEDSDSD